MAILFFSYSHADEALRDRLEVGLAMLKNQGVIDGWHDRRIPAGNEFAAAIDEQMKRADIILLLVSPDFLASRYCYDIEMTLAMERHAKGEARVIPIILRPSQWHDAPFGKLQALPKDGKPVTKHADLDDAFLEIANSIKAVTVQPGTPAARKRATSSSSPSPGTLQAGGTVRSSNLRLKKTFTQADEDRFLDEAFEFMATFFEGSLSELEQRNPGIETRFKRLDATAFTAVVYRNGNPVTRCRIFLGSPIAVRGIAYSDDDRSDGHSFNESLAVVHDEQALGMRPLGFGNYGSKGTEFLTLEGGAELYWARLMESLQR